MRFPLILLRSAKHALAALTAVFILSGCSSVVNSHTQKEDMMDAYLNGDNESALDEIEYKLREPAWYNSSVVNTGDELMWRLEAGSMYFHVGDFQQCLDQLRRAEELIENYDDRASISFRNVGAEAGASFTNLNALPYRGFCRDRIALAVYKALAYLGTGNEEAFHAQIRRLRNEQKKVQDDFSEYFEAENEFIEEEKAGNPEAAKALESSGQFAGLIGDSRNADFMNNINNVREVANRGYGDFLNPAAIFLSGLASVRDENYENARIDFQRLTEAMPNNPLFKQYYVTALREAGRDIPAGMAGVPAFDFPLDRDCVFVIFANGRSATFEQDSIYFPIMTAWPSCVFYDAPFRYLEAEAGSRRFRSTILADMDGIIAQEFDELLPGIVTRIVLNTLIKEGAYYGGITAVAVQNIDPTVKTVALLSIIIGGAIYRAAMNTADTRSWEILPKEFQLTQFPMPDNKQVTLSLAGASGGSSYRLQLPADSRSAIIFVDAPSEQNIAIHVLPLKSK